jgi:hypothetical protein
MTIHDIHVHFGILRSVIFSCILLIQTPSWRIYSQMIITYATALYDNNKFIKTVFLKLWPMMVHQMVDNITQHAINNLNLKHYFKLVDTKSFTATLTIIALLFAGKKTVACSLWLRGNSPVVCVCADRPCSDPQLPKFTKHYIRSCQQT